MPANDEIFASLIKIYYFELMKYISETNPILRGSVKNWQVYLEQNCWILLLDVGEGLILMKEHLFLFFEIYVRFFIKSSIAAIILIHIFKLITMSCVWWFWFDTCDNLFYVFLLCARICHIKNCTPYIVFWIL